MEAESDINNPNQIGISSNIHHSLKHLHPHHVYVLILLHSLILALTQLTHSTHLASSPTAFLDQAKAAASSLANTASQAAASASQLASQAATAAQPHVQAAYAAAQPHLQTAGSTIASAASQAGTAASNLASQAHAQAAQVAPGMIPAPTSSGVDTSSDLKVGSLETAKLDKFLGGRPNAKELQDQGILYGEFDGFRMIVSWNTFILIPLFFPFFSIGAPDDIYAGQKHDLMKAQLEVKSALSCMV